MRAIMFAAAVALGAISVSVHAQMITQEQIDRKREKDKVKLLKLTPADFQKAVEIEDDDLDPIATLSTEKGFRSTGGLFVVQGSDVLLRAHVGKRTGQTTYQVYGYVWYKETQERRYHMVNYQRDGDIAAVALSNVASKVISCDQYSAALGCTRSEDFVFPVAEELLQSIAARPVDQIWRMKFRAQAGIDWEEMIAPAEAAGLLSAVTAYKSAHGLEP